LPARHEAKPRGVPSVINVEVSDKTKTATVTFDDAKTDLKSLTEATTAAGYPSFLYTEGMLWP
jgi:periplasmic mercuric ion binding protein